MKYVIDTSLAFKWYVAEVDSAKAIQLRTDYNNAIHDLIAPELFLPEMANALASAEKSGRISSGEAMRILPKVIVNSPGLVPTAPLLSRALGICLQTRRSLYDCLYVTLAEREGCEFITADDRLVKALQPRFPFVISLSTWQ